MLLRRFKPRSVKSKSKNKKVKVLVAQWCLTLCDPMDCYLPGSSIHGIFQARIPVWGAIPFSRGSFPPRFQIGVSCIGRQILYHLSHKGSPKSKRRCQILYSEINKPKQACKQTQKTDLNSQHDPLSQ